MILWWALAVVVTLDTFAETFRDVTFNGVEVFRVLSSLLGLFGGCNNASFFPLLTCLIYAALTVWKRTHIEEKTWARPVLNPSVIFLWYIVWLCKKIKCFDKLSHNDFFRRFISFFGVPSSTFFSLNWLTLSALFEISSIWADVFYLMGKLQPLFAFYEKILKRALPAHSCRWLGKLLCNPTPF